MKLTKWYPFEIKPVHKGVYRTGIINFTGVRYSYWDGEWWYYQRKSIADASKEQERGVQLKNWRGLAEKP